VVWILTAPSHPTNFDLITVQLDSLPADENTNQPAFVANGEVIIPIRTGDELITVDNITARLGIDKKVVPKGSRDITLLGIEIANPRDSADPVSVDTILVSLLDKNGQSVSNPSRTLTELYVVRGNDAFPGDVNQDPVMVVLNNVRILAEKADTLTFAVSISNNAALDEFTISIENGDALVIKNTISGERVPVSDKTTLGGVTGKLRSRPLVILSNNPQEYAHNYPNPFRAGNQETNIAYVVDKDGAVSVRIYDLTGALVYERRYARGDPGTNPGPQEVTWNGRNDNGEVVRNGVYVCQIDTASGSVRIKIAVAK
ncbi:MAG: T9SS type A sorting domain-containing protein, partial [Candidatus Krumholzibacteria bacterium]|nr:T9SS type A sorting domain-containing protein [Candidatus Krumholzibacteria bacterium]